MLFRRLALALLVILFAVNVYRAATQAIAVDEAFAWQKMLSGSWRVMFNSFDACHHFLYTYLSWVSIHLFGVSAFTLRVPALLAGALYFAAVYRISLWLFGASWRLLLAMAALSLNPYILDFLSAARGYGLALACLLWALFETCRAVSTPAAHLVRAALWLSFSVASNLTFLFPSLALVTVTLAASPAARRAGLRYLAAFAVPAGALIAFPLSHAKRDNFYYGSTKFEDTWNSLAQGSLLYPPPAFLPAAWQAHYHAMAAQIVHFMPWIVAALAIPFAFALAGAVRARFQNLNPAPATLLVSGATLAVTAAGLLAAHWMFALVFPIDRTGLYLIPLVTLTALAAAGGPLLPRAFQAALVLAVVLFAAAFHTTYYRDWPYCRALKPMLAMAAADRPGGATVRLGGSFVFEPPLNFYRETQHLAWYAPVVRADPDAPADFYFLFDEDLGVVSRNHLRVLFQDPVSLATLAAPENGP